MVGVGKDAASPGVNKIQSLKWPSSWIQPLERSKKGKERERTVRDEKTEEEGKNQRWWKEEQKQEKMKLMNEEE